MPTGLSLSDIVNISVNISPNSAQPPSFSTLLILGSSPVIDTVERIRSYANINNVVQDFGSTAPEYLAAQLFFSQSPKPSQLYIGRWAKVDTSGTLKGGVLTPTQQLLSNFTSITSGSMKIDVDGVTKTLTGLNFSSATNLNGVANIIDVALVGAVVVWNASSARFEVTSGSIGINSKISYASTTAGGTDISGLIGLVTGVASVPIDGIASESLLASVLALADVSSRWYGLTIATSPLPSIAEIQGVAAYMEASQRSRMFASTIPTTLVLDPTSSLDLASNLKSFKYRQSLVQYSSSSPYATASLLGRMLTVDFSANRSTITLKFKQEPGIQAETLTETQAATLKGKNCNVFVNYENDTAIIQEGVMCDGTPIEEIHGLNWLQNNIQTKVYNLFYTSTTKIPQTDAGMNMIAAVIAQAAQEAVNNGLIAPGIWNADGFGQLKKGDYLSSGYYIYVPLIGTQDQATREKGIAPTIQLAFKGAGAIRSANIILNFNR